MGDLQAFLGLWPRFGQQPDASPQATLDQQAPEPVDTVADRADAARRTARRATVVVLQVHLSDSGAL